MDHIPYANLTADADGRVMAKDRASAGQAIE